MSVTFYADGQHLNEDAPTLNVSNSNARMLFNNLGLYEEATGDLVGRITPTDLLIAIACSNPMDDATPDFVSKRAGGPLMIDCGHPHGYVRDRFEDLKKVARFAHEVGADITFC